MLGGSNHHIHATTTSTTTTIMSNNRILSALYLLLSCCLVASCSDNATDPPVTGPQHFTLQFVPMFGATPLVFDTPYQTIANETVRFTGIKFYVTGIELIPETGAAVEIDTLILVDFTMPNNSATGLVELSTMANAGSYKAVHFHIGVPQASNHLDAATQGPPLGPNSGMYWSWVPGYIFHRIEGRVDVDGVNTTFAYHIGEDSRYQHIILDAPFTIGKDTTTVVVHADYSKLFTQGLTPGEPLQPGKNDNERVHHVGPKALADRTAANTATLFSITVK